MNLVEDTRPRSRLSQSRTARAACTGRGSCKELNDTRRIRFVDRYRNLEVRLSTQRLAELQVVFERELKLAAAARAHHVAAAAGRRHMCIVRSRPVGIRLAILAQPVAQHAAVAAAAGVVVVLQCVEDLITED